ncbi:MAG: hypothetical protein ACWIPJ_01685 [Polaribacter sp.]
MKSNKILNILIAVIAIIGVVLFIRIFSEDSELLKTDGDLQNKVISPIIYFATFLVWATVIIALFLSVWSLIRNPKKLGRTLLGVGVLGVLLIVAYSMSDSDAVLNTQGAVLEGGEAGTAMNKWVGTGILYSIILVGLASISFVYDLVKGLIKS